MKVQHGHNRRIKGINKPSSTYRTWRSMTQRCNCKSYSSYEQYGGIGVKVCKRWEKFENFLKDMGERPIGTTLDRIKQGNYTPKNCRWATPKQQARNKKTTTFVTYKNKKLSLAEVIENHSLVDNKTVRARLKRNWKLEDALTFPSNRGQRYGS